MKHWKRWSAAAVCLVLLASAVPVRAENLQQKLDNAKQEGNALQQQKTDAESTLASLNTQMTALNTSIAETQTSINAKLADIEIAEEELTQAMLEEAAQYQAMKLRIKYCYENGNDTNLAILLEAEDMSDLLNKVEYVETLSTYDRNMLIAYQETVAAVEAKKVQLQGEYDELTALETSLTTQQAEVQTLIDSQQAAISQLTAELGANSAEIASLQGQLDAYNASLAEAQKFQGGGGSSSASYSGSAGASVVSGSGELANPCPSGSITSTFGYRTFDNSFHKGIDLACGTGSPIYAADGGTVMIAGWSSSAGNWIVINHGNGMVTKYMHCSVLYVHAGESVAKGQNIAGVGSTGYSTGPHLHFQVEVNGTAVNPAGYL